MTAINNIVWNWHVSINFYMNKLICKLIWNELFLIHKLIGECFCKILSCHVVFSFALQVRNFYYIPAYFDLRYVIPWSEIDENTRTSHFTKITNEASCRWGQNFNKMNYLCLLNRKFEEEARISFYCRETSVCLHDPCLQEKRCYIYKQVYKDSAVFVFKQLL